MLANLEALTADDIRHLWAARWHESGARNWNARYGLSRGEASREDTDPLDRLRVAYLGGLIAFPAAPRGTCTWEVFEGYKYLGLHLPWSAEWANEWFEGFPDLGGDIVLDDLLYLWEHRDIGPGALPAITQHPLMDTNEIRVKLERLISSPGVGGAST